jgi:hypothetical protein
MSHPYHHAESSARKYGGKPEDYLEIHSWFDASKAYMAHYTHRALRHHAQGIFECERLFGVTITNSDGRKIPVRFIGEQHCREDCGGRVPSLEDWFSCIQPERWMSVGQLRSDVALAPDGQQDLSMTAWQGEVLRGATILGYADWCERERLKGNELRTGADT